MLGHTDLKKGTRFILNGIPHEVLENSFLFKGRGSSVVQIKARNLLTGAVVSRTIHAGEEFEEAEIEEFNAIFIYNHRDKYVFSKKENPRFRFELKREQLPSLEFLKPNTEVRALRWKEKIISIKLSIKVQLKVVEAPPTIKGERAQSATKQVVLETGVRIPVPAFIKQGDIIEVNTETKEYVRRIS